MKNSTKRNIDEKSFSELLTDSFYTIPLYQRGYSWDNYNLETLWDDIRHIRDIPKNSEDGNNNHFMSSILVKDVGDSPKHIVDGQQRITTIILFLHAAADVLRANEHRFVNSDSYKMIEQDLEKVLYGNIAVIDAVTGRKVKEITMPRLTLQRAENDPNNAYTIIGDKNKGASAWTDKEKDSKLYTAYQFFLRKLKSVISEFDGCGKFQDTINVVLDKLYVIYIPILEHEAPQKIFESVNGLTKKLYAGELIKNYILMSLKNEDETKSVYKEYWSDFDEPYWTKDDTRKAALTKQFYFWILSQGYNSKKVEPENESVYRAFKDLIDLPSLSTAAAEIKAKEISADINHILMKMSALEAKKDNPTNRLEFSYNRLFTINDAKNCQAIFMKFLRLINQLEKKFGVLTYDQLDRLLLPVESFIMRKFMHQGYSCEITDYLLKIIDDTFDKGNKLDYYSSLDSYLNKNVLNFVEMMKNGTTVKKRFETNENLYNYVVGDRQKEIFPQKAFSTDLANTLLVQVENHLSKTKLTPNGKPLTEKYSVEHWLPRVSSSDKWPLQVEAARKTYTYSLGNLCLVPSRINSQLSNKILSEKRKIIQLEQGDAENTEFKTLNKTMELSKDGLWDEDRIEQRARWLIDFLLNEIFLDLHKLGVKRHEQGVFKI